MALGAAGRRAGAAHGLRRSAAPGRLRRSAPRDKCAAPPRCLGDIRDSLRAGRSRRDTLRGPNRGLSLPAHHVADAAAGSSAAALSMGAEGKRRGRRLCGARLVADSAVAAADCDSAGGKPLSLRVAHAAAGLRRFGHSRRRGARGELDEPDAAHRALLPPGGGASPPRCARCG